MRNQMATANQTPTEALPQLRVLVRETEEFPEHFHLAMEVGFHPMSGGPRIADN